MYNRGPYHLISRTKLLDELKECQLQITLGSRGLFWETKNFQLISTTKGFCHLSCTYSVFLNRKFPSPWTRSAFEVIFIIKKKKNSQANYPFGLITECLSFISGHCKMECEPLPWRINIPANKIKINVIEIA